MKSCLISVVSKSSLLLLLFSILNQSAISQDLDDSLNSQIEEISTLESPFTEYFNPLSSSEAQKNYDGINQNGRITATTSVPNNRPINDSRVSDPHYMLSSAAIDTINGIIKLVESETGYQMAVVCLNSIGDNNPNAFGTELFNLWGIGEAGKDNGFLMLVINDVHRVEFINGRGTEVVLSDLAGENIRQNEMIPYFKKNDYVTGVIRGLQAVSEVFYGVSDYTNPSSTQNESVDYSGLDNYYDYAYSGPPWYEHGLFLTYLLIGCILMCINLLFLGLCFLTRNLHKRYHVLKFFNLLIFPIVFPIPLLIMYFINKKIMERWRNTERFSEVSGMYMFKLDEKSDNEFLKSGQIKEEEIKSIDYDVWITPDKADTLILAYKKWFSKFRKCPSCKFKTYFKEYDRVISAATYSSSGTGERCYSCKSCGHTKITTYTIPMKTRSESSSGGSYSSGSSGGGYSGGGGSSYGGGSSGGGGGGSSW